MAHDLENKIAMVSGASQGIGFACARELIRRGSSVALAARTRDDVDAAAVELQAVANQVGADGHALGVQADLSLAEGVNHFVEETMRRFGGGDALVCSHGGSKGAHLLELPDEYLLEAWQTKLLGGIRLTRAVVPIMEKRGGGSIVLISGASRGPAPDRVPAWSTNGAQRAWVSAVAEDLARRGIGINIVNPGNVETRRNRASNERLAKERGVPVEQVRRERMARYVTRHLTQPEEIADLVAFLCARRVINIVGQELDAWSTF